MSDSAPPPEARLQPDTRLLFTAEARASRLKSLHRISWPIIMLAWLVRFSALLNLISALLPGKPQIIHRLSPWIPFEISEGRHIRMFLMSILLFILASGLMRGKRAAWLCTIGTLAFLPLLHLGHVTILPQVIVNLILIGFLLLYRNYFTAKSDRKAVKSALIICPLLALALLIFGTMRLHDLRDETSGGDDWLACMQTACELEFAHKTVTQQPETKVASDLFSTLRIAGTLIALLGLFLTLRPVLIRRMSLGGNREKVRKLIDQYGEGPDDSYALLHDKRYLFTTNEEAVVPYVLSGNIAVALADPIGAREMRPHAIADFALYCRQHDWEPVFYGVTEDLIPYYKQAGLSLFKIGEGARLSAEQFHLKGHEFQNLRTLRNGARRHGIQFRWYDARDGLDETLEQQLALISRRWLDVKRAREMSFDMGSFSLEEIRQHGAAIALDSGGSPLAFATWRPFAQGKGRALDLMRTLPQARNVMDFVLVESIARFTSMGIREINLGLAPLANTEKAPSRLVAEDKVVQFLFENLNHIYGYKSLFEFKRKYRPHWQGRYVAYRRGVHLPLVGLALVRIHAPAGLWKLLFP